MTVADSTAGQVGLSVVVLAGLVAFTELTIRTIVPMAVIVLIMGCWNLIDERYEIPDGTGWEVYGASILIAGAYLAVAELNPLVGTGMALVGGWFIFDGVTTVRYESPQSPDAYAAGLGDDSSELMLRMQVLSSVYQALKDADSPLTVGELTTKLDLSKSRTEAALGFLERKGRVRRDGQRYEASPSRWGRLAPVVRAVNWVPRRFLKPFRRVAKASR